MTHSYPAAPMNEGQDSNTRVPTERAGKALTQQQPGQFFETRGHCKSAAALIWWAEGPEDRRSVVKSRLGARDLFFSRESWLDIGGRVVSAAEHITEPPKAIHRPSTQHHGQELRLKLGGLSLFTTTAQAIAYKQVGRSSSWGRLGSGETSPDGL